MADLTTLARPYAKAAFESARDDNTLAEWSEVLALLAAMSEQSTVKALIGTPNLTAQQKSAEISTLCGDVLNGKMKNFVATLGGNQRLGLLPSISVLFDLFKANQEKSVDVTIETAFTLRPDQTKVLAASLEKTLARDVVFSTRLNEDLIGGVFIRAGDTVIDASIRGRLAKLASTMNA